MTDVRALVINTLDEVAGVRSNAAFARALQTGDDISLDALEVDSLSRFEAIMRIEEDLSIEIDDDEMVEQQTLNRLIAFIEARAARRAL
jgi:acyl carrier protein